MSGSHEWQTGTPESRGLDPNKLADLWKGLVQHATSGFLLIKDDTIVLEKYAEGWNARKPHYTASMAKALVGGMSLTLALDDGLIDPDDLVSKFVPQWKDDPLKAKVTVRHLATHTSGMEDAQSATHGHMEIPGWMGDFWRQDPDPFSVSRDQCGILFGPGTASQYSNPGMAMLSYAITVAIKNGPHKDVRTLLQERVMRPIGVGDDEWSVGYGKTFDVEGFPLVANWGGGSFTARATARVVRLMMRKGNWEGKQLIKAETVEQVLAHAGCPNYSGLSWWVNVDGKGNPRSAHLPADAFQGSGAGNQIGGAIPSMGIIFVRNGDSLDKNSNFGNFDEHLFGPMMKAIK